MRTVNISDLKAKLSHYLRTLKSGGRIIIVDRHRPVAMLTDINTESTLSIEEAVCTMDDALRKLPKLASNVLSESSLNSTEILTQDRERR